MRSYVRWSYPAPRLQLSIRLQRYEKNSKKQNVRSFTVNFIKFSADILHKRKKQRTFAKETICWVIAPFEERQNNQENIIIH